MIDLIPRENRRRSQAVAEEADAFGMAHFDGTGWTDVYILPDVAAAHPLAERQIPVAALHGLLAPHLPPADVVESGYSTYREAVPNSFAFGTPGAGAFYGSQAGGVIKALHFIPCNDEDSAAIQFFGAALTTLGERYALILVDWWHDQIIDLSDQAAIERYLRRDDDDESDEQED
jgi:hypothetical protein